MSVGSVIVMVPVHVSHSFPSVFILEDGCRKPNSTLQDLSNIKYIKCLAQGHGMHYVLNQRRWS